MKTYPVTHNGKQIGTIDVPEKVRMTPRDYALAKSLLMMCEKASEKHGRLRQKVKGTKKVESGNRKTAMRVQSGKRKPLLGTNARRVRSKSK